MSFHARINEIRVGKKLVNLKIDGLKNIIRDFYISNRTHYVIKSAHSYGNRHGKKFKLILYGELSNEIRI